MVLIESLLSMNRHVLNFRKWTKQKIKYFDQRPVNDSMPCKAKAKIMEINATLDFARKKFHGRQRNRHQNLVYCLTLIHVKSKYNVYKRQHKKTENKLAGN
jgi:hypothetical protein